MLPQFYAMRSDGGANPNRPRTCRRQIMHQLCAHLDQLTTPETRTAVELPIDIGRHAITGIQVHSRTAFKERVSV